MRLSRPNVLLFAALGVILVVALRFYLSPERRLKNAAIDRRLLAVQVLGRYLAQDSAGSRALVIGNPFVKEEHQPPEVRAFEQAAITGLARGWGDDVEMVGTAYPELNPAALRNPAAIPMPPNATTPLSFMTVEGAWDRIKEAHPEADVWVSLIGVPKGITRTRVWRSDTPRLALLFPDLRLVGNAGEVLRALESRKLVAFVMRRPGAPPQSDEAAADDQAEFDRRFLLVTPDSAKEILTRFPGLF